MATGSPEAWFQNHGGFAASRAGQLQMVIAHVDELPGQGLGGCLVDLLRHGVDAAADSRKGGDR